MFTNRYKFNVPRLLLDGQVIQLKNDMKYPWMVVERSLLFKGHIIEAASKAEKMANVLGSFMLNILGPKGSRRKLFVPITIYILLYGAPS